VTDRAKASSSMTARSPRARIRRLSLATLCLVAGALSLGSGLASAGTGVSHPFLFSFDGSGTPKGWFQGESLAIDESGGKVYVLDFYNGLASEQGNVVDVFDTSDGHYLSRLDGSNTPQGSFIFHSGSQQLAVDNSGGPTNGNLYVTACTPEGSSNPECLKQYIDVFDSAGNYLSQIDGSAAPAGPFPKGGVFGLSVSLLQGAERRVDLATVIDECLAPAIWR
jgi:hypothetical protein